MDSRTYICLFDLRPYDQRVAPALRAYAHDSDPRGVAALLREAFGVVSGPAKDDFKHWADSIEPDAGHQPSEQTIRELGDMLIPVFCVRQMQAIEPLVPWLSEQSEWFADLVDGGEELAGGRLEFGFGTGRLIATRQQIRRFLEELRAVEAPSAAVAAPFANLRTLVTMADSNQSYTLFKTSLAVQEVRR